MPARTKARKRALDILFEAEIRGEPVLDLLAERKPARQVPSGHVRAPLAPPHAAPAANVLPAADIPVSHH